MMGLNRTSLKTLLGMALLTLALAAPARAAIASEQKKSDTAGIGTVEIFKAAVEAFPACLDYCITGISIRLHFDGSWNIYFSPLIRHNSADFVVQSYMEHGKEPWTEWAKVMGTAQKTVLTPILPKLLGVDHLSEYFSGQTRYTHYGRHQTHNLKESDVIGNPFIVLILLLDSEVQDSWNYNSGGDGGDERQCQTEGCLERRDDETGEQVDRELETERERQQAEEEGRPWHEMTTEELYAAASEEVQETIGDYQRKIENCANDLRCVMDIVGGQYFNEVFSILDTIETALRYIRTVKKVIEIIVTIVKLYFGGYATVSAELRIERYLCANEHTPFVPYYLSGIDFMFWRDGFPITDPHKAATIFNPLSGDGIGPDKGLRSERWGHTYPRSGFVDNAYDAKVGAVTAVRSQDIVAEQQRRRLRWNGKGFGIDGRDGWQMIYPQREAICHPNIGDTPAGTMTSTLTNAEGDPDARYAWNYWRPYACDTNEKGHQIAKIDFAEPVCLDIDVKIEADDESGSRGTGGNGTNNNEGGDAGDF